MTKKTREHFEKTFDYHFNFRELIIVFWILGFKPLFSHSCESTIPVANETIRPCEIHLIEKIRFTYRVLNVVVLKLVQVPKGIHFTLTLML